MMNLKIAELRKRNGLTQQELGEKLGVTFQTVSKWENEVTMPDITMLPQLGRIFHVSVDELLGLVPLKGEEYLPTNTDTKEYWNKRVDYQKRTRKWIWNTDYVQFLVDKVWKIDKPVDVLDCGCGFGAWGLLLLPLLPEGSTYTGIDFSEEMLREAQIMFDKYEVQGTFIHADFRMQECRKQYDLVLSQAVLRHVDNAKTWLEKMIAFAKKDGLIVSMECNREFEEDGLYIAGMDYAALCEHEGLKKLWKTEFSVQKRDYSIAMKVPHLMKHLGLSDVDIRMNDKATFLYPEKEDYKQELEDWRETHGWMEEPAADCQADGIRYFMNHGMDRKEAEDYYRKNSEIRRFMDRNAGEVALTKVVGIMISFGWKR